MEWPWVRAIALRSLLCFAAIFSVSCRLASKPEKLAGVAARSAFTGLVRDSITPVPDVAVALYKGASLMARTVTDRRGRFSFESQPPGDYRFSLSSVGYAACSIDVSFWPPQQDYLIGVVPAYDSARVQRQRGASGSPCSCRKPVNRTRRSAVSSSRSALPSRKDHCQR